MHKCWHCGHDLIWNNDFSFDDMGYEGEGIVSLYTCSNIECEAEYECALEYREDW